MKHIKDFSGDDVLPEWDTRFSGERCVLTATVTKSLRWLVLLGTVKKKNDGRWEWTILNDRSGFYKKPETTTKMQGVCDTEEEAKKQVELAWGVA
jgi:hypothetical protein